MWSEKILLLLIIALSSCSGSGSKNQRTNAGQNNQPAPGLELVEQVDDYGYTEKINRRITDSIRHGGYLRVNKEGVPVEEATYENGALHQQRVMYYDNGDTLLVENYANGDFEGAYRQYYENGNLQILGYYENNKATGEWRQFYDTGELMEIVTFGENLENGPFSEYYKNGKLKAEGNYLNGDNEHGELKLYDEQGKLVRKMSCEEGLCKTVWSAEEDD